MPLGAKWKKNLEKKVKFDPKKLKLQGPNWKNKKKRKRKETAIAKQCISPKKFF
jgi:hypothetical protein